MALIEAFSLPTFKMASSSCQCRLTDRDCGDFWLPISRRGHFFSDSFFQNTRNHFHSAIQEMLNNWKDVEKFSEDWLSNKHFGNSLTLYRQLKSARNEDDLQAYTTLSDTNTYKVVIDVQDFLEGDIKVKVLGEKEVLVEGQGRTSSGEGSFTSSRRILCRKFTFPSDVNMAEVTSVLSSDGVLTIEAPKLNTNGKTLFSREIPVIKESSSVVNTTNDSVADITDSSCTEKAKDDVIYYCRDCNKKIGSWNKPKEIMSTLREGAKLPMNITTENEKIIPVQQESSLESRKDKNTKYIKIEQEKEEESKEETSQKQLDLQIENRTNNQRNWIANRPSYDIPVMSSFSILPFSLGGPFFSDSFFSSVHKDFQSAVQEVLSRWGALTSMIMEDNLSAYRKIRLQDLREETQAVKTSEDETNHKFVLDVQDFMNEGEVTIKAINDREIVVEGHVEKEVGGSKSQKRFLKRFTVPGNLQLDSVSSVMSSDGVLTITAPKKPSSIQLKEITAPLSVEGTEVRDLEKRNIKVAHQSSKTFSSSTGHNVSIEHIVPIDVEGASKTSSSQSDHRSNRASIEHVIPIEIEEISNCTSGQKLSHQQTVQGVCEEKTNESRKLPPQANLAQREHIIPVNVEGKYDKPTEALVKCQKERPNEGVQEKMAKDQTVTDRVIPINVETSSNTTKEQSMTHQKNNNVLPANGKEASTAVTGTSLNKTINIQTEINKDESSTKRQSGKYHFAHQRTNAAANNDKVSDTLACTSVESQYLPISRKGLFLDDTFFQDYRNKFQEAVRDVLIKSRRFIENTDCMTAYRNLRQNDLKVENQALYAQEDNESFKVAVDAKDFTDGDLTVRVEGEELVIEGKAENSETKSSKSLSFSHRFLLPESFDISTVSSAISSDGILTVMCPKGLDASSTDGVRKMSSEARSKQESHDEGSHKWEEKKVKQSSEKGDGYSSSSFCRSYQSCQQQSAKF